MIFNNNSVLRAKKNSIITKNLNKSKKVLHNNYWMMMTINIRDIVIIIIKKGLNRSQNSR